MEQSESVVAMPSFRLTLVYGYGEDGRPAVDLQIEGAGADPDLTTILGAMRLAEHDLITEGGEDG